MCFLGRKNSWYIMFSSKTEENCCLCKSCYVTINLNIAVTVVPTSSVIFKKTNKQHLLKLLVFFSSTIQSSLMECPRGLERIMLLTELLEGTGFVTLSNVVRLMFGCVFGAPPPQNCFWSPLAFLKKLPLSWTLRERVCVRMYKIIQRKKLLLNIKVLYSIEKVSVTS